MASGKNVERKIGISGGRATTKKKRRGESCVTAESSTAPRDISRELLAQAKTPTARRFNRSTLFIAEAGNRFFARCQVSLMNSLLKSDTRRCSCNFFGIEGI